MKKRIAWITATAFIDTDIYIIPILQKQFDIDWYIVKRAGEILDYQDTIAKIEDNCKIRIVETGRNRSFITLQAYNTLFKNIKNEKYDLIYTAMANFPYYTVSLAHYIDINKVIMGIHNVHIPKGGTHYYLMKIYNEFTIRKFKNFHTFSQNQSELLAKLAPTKRVRSTTFIPKDYGKTSKKRSDSRITFMNFGNIRDYKKIDVLIRAAECAFNKTGINFRVIIAGQCNDWEKYEKDIVHSNLFELHIKRIENSEIPNLFAETDYFVMPYLDIAQSGSMMVAINYEKPVIASDLPAFRECLEDNKTGFFIRPANEVDLTEKMVYVLKNHQNIYHQMIKDVKQLKKEKYSYSIIAQDYIDYFNEVINEN